MSAFCCWKYSFSKATSPFHVHRPSYSSWLPRHRWRHNALHDAFLRRSAAPYSTLTPAPPASETVEVACRANRSITLNIFHPFTSTSCDPIILYLPAGPVLEPVNSQAVDDVLIAALSASSNATIVRVNYRAGSGSPYPVPIHDVLTGYDWVLGHLAEENATELRRLGVVGQLLGGSLASMLALTECRLGQSRIAAAAINNPIVDWVEPDREDIAQSLSDQEKASVADDADLETRDMVLKGKKREKRKKKVSSWQEFNESRILSARTVLRARTRLFHGDDGFFDPFASPMHFFRTAGIDVPQDLKSLPYDPDEGPQTPKLLRKARRVWPPSGSNIVLPHVRLSSGEESLLLSQNEEFMERLDASEVARNLKGQGLRLEQYKHLDEDQRNEVDFVCDQADLKFQISRLPGVGLWGLGRESDWRHDIESAGTWLRRVLTS